MMGTVDRRPYESAMSVTQNLLDQCQDNLSFKLEFIAEIKGVGIGANDIYISDRAKYVGDKYYEPRTKFPAIDRTMGDWLSPELEWSSLTLTILNADGKYSKYLPGGAEYDGFTGCEVNVKVGLGEIETSFIYVFSGFVTDVGGFARDNASFTLTCRSRFEKVNQPMPNQTLTKTDFPDLEDEKIGLFVPVIYGDWTTSLRPEAPEIPAFPINGLNPGVIAGTTPIRAVISSVPLRSVDTSSVVLWRGDIYYPIPAGDIAIVPLSDNQVIDITQQGFLIDGTPWTFNTGDEFFLKCLGVDLGLEQDNIIAQAYDILKRFGGLIDDDFSYTWVLLKNKTSPAESAIKNIKSRVWQQEERKAMEYALSMLEQVRVEIFVNRDNFFSLRSLHFDEMVVNPSFMVQNWDIIRDSFKPETDSLNQFNVAKADFSYSPPIQENRYSTPKYINPLNITQCKDRQIGKLITFPNLYIESDVTNQLKEILKLAAYLENIEMNLTSRAFLQDLGEDIALNINIGSVIFEGITEPVTGRIRLLNYDPETMSIFCKLWCFQMVPFPGSLKVGIPGITGGSTATIIQE